jgi:RNA polymerase-binding transcription factor DksA
MSADNEVAVVKFPDGTYRVGEIRGCPDYNEQAIAGFLVAFQDEFDKAMFTTSEQADDYAEQLAQQIEEQYGYLEYGVTQYDAAREYYDYLGQPCSTCTSTIPYERILAITGVRHCVTCAAKYPPPPPDPNVLCARASESGQNGFAPKS